MTLDMPLGPSRRKSANPERDTAENYTRANRSCSSLEHSRQRAYLSERHALTMPKAD
jgi:hypothetical protein